MPTILNLSNGATTSVPSEFNHVFSRIGFGQYGTLLAWNKERVVTFAIAFPDQLTALWETKLSNLVNDDVMFFPSESIREWIALTNECLSLTTATVRDRIHSGNLIDTVRSTTLAIMIPRRMIMSERDYRQVGYHLYSREPSRANAGTAFFDIRSKTPVRIYEFKQPNFDFIVDISSDGSTILLRDIDEQYSKVTAESWLWESIDRHDLPGPIQSLALVEGGQLLSVTQLPNAYEHQAAEFDRCAAPYDQTVESEHWTLNPIESAKPSEDCSIIADYLENQIRVKSLDDPAKEYPTPTLTEWLIAAERAWSRGAEAVSLTVYDEKLDKLSAVFVAATKARSLQNP